MSSTLAAGSLEAECLGGLDWAWYGLGECIRSSGDKVSIAFGVLSIVAWFLFGLPQIVENFRSKIPDAAVSIFLLIFWLLGDSLNLIGAFLTYQLFLQVNSDDCLLIANNNIATLHFVFLPIFTLRISYTSSCNYRLRLFRWTFVSNLENFGWLHCLHRHYPPIAICLLPMAAQKRNKT